MGAQELVSPATLQSFAPLLGERPQVLILGSMPGAASLAAGQYYAHPRNAFWPIMAELFGATLDLPYVERAARLMEAGVAVWDVLAECRRPGSLDANIEPDSLRANDIAGLIEANPSLTLIAFNGGTAERLFKRLALPQLRAAIPDPPARLRLPSTSPAHAARNFADKLAAWRAALRPGA